MKVFVKMIKGKTILRVFYFSFQDCSENVHTARSVVYVNCNPATPVRDLRILEDGGYKNEGRPAGGHVPAVESCGVLFTAP